MRTPTAGLEVEVLQHEAGTANSAVVLCHGFGAPGRDLVPMHEELVARAPRLARTRFFFPAAPLELPGWGDARAWWLIDVEAVSRLATDPAGLRAFRQQEPPGMARARAVLLKLVDEVAIATGLPMAKVALGGFSQGAMVSTDVALRTEERCAGLAVLSGTLLLEDTWRQKATARAGLPVFQWHGRQDPILPFAAAQLLHQMLADAGAAVEFQAFEGGHTITAAELDALAQFLVRVLG